MADRHPDLGPDEPLPFLCAPSSTPFALSITCPECGCGPNIPCILKYNEPGDCHVARTRLASGLPPFEKTPAAPVDHIRPKHYGGPEDPYEPLKVMLAQHGKDAVVHFCWLTAEKYLARAGKKPNEPVSRDLRKAAFYLTHAAELLEKP